jgi:magnesium-transporting ATPase (P-type)
LRVDPLKGLPNDEGYLNERRSKFGPNTIPRAEAKSFLRLVFDASRDPTLIILVVAGIVSLVLSFFETGESEDKQNQMINGTLTNSA